MADVEFNGSQGTVPDFAMEDTQAKILTALQKQFKLTSKDLALATRALKEEEKNSKGQIEALNNFGNNIKDALNAKGSLLGGLTSGVTGTLKATRGFASHLGSVTGMLATFAGAIVTTTLNLSKGFGDDLKSAGLAETGAAFGALGAELNDVVPGLMTLGLSVDQAAGAINDFRGSMTQMSGTAIQGVITKFQEITNNGAQFGKTISESVEALSEELEYRARLGFLDEQTTARAAADAQEIMDSQISATKLLGKSVDEIANGVKDLFTGDLDIAASLANLGPDVEKELRKTFQTFEGAGLPKSFQAGLAKMITDPVMLASQDAQDTFAAFQILPDGIGDKVQSSVENLRMALDMPEGAERKQAIKDANKALEENMLEAGASIQGLSKEQREQLFIMGQSNSMIKELLSSQNTLAQAYENYNDKTSNELNKSLANSVIFDNQVTMLSNMFNVLLTAVKSGMSPALEKFTDALGSMTDENSPIFKFRVRLEDIAGKITKKLGSIFGMTDDLGENTTWVSSMLETLGDYVESAADTFLEFVEYLMEDTGQPLIPKIGGFFLNEVMIPLFKELAKLLGEAWRSIDLWDLVFGDSKDEFVTDTASKVDSNRKDIERSGYDKETKANMLEDRLDFQASEIQDFADKRDMDPSKTLQMIRDAGIEVNELSGKKLLEMFPDPEDLKTAISDSYGDTGDEIWKSASEKIATGAEQVIKEQGHFLTETGKKLLESDEETESRHNLNKNLLATWNEAKTQELKPVVEPKKPEEPVLPALEEIVVTATRLDEPTGTRPVATSATGIQKDPENAEPTTTSPSSQDGTKTQSVKPAEKENTSQTPESSTTDDLLKTLISKSNDTNRLLGTIRDFTGATAGNTA